MSYVGDMTQKQAVENAKKEKAAQAEAAALLDEIKAEWYAELADAGIDGPDAQEAANAAKLSRAEAARLSRIVKMAPDEIAQVRRTAIERLLLNEIQPKHAAAVAEVELASTSEAATSHKEAVKAFGLCLSICKRLLATVHLEAGSGEAEGKPDDLASRRKKARK